jgi:hypothetical protein
LGAHAFFDQSLHKNIQTLLPEPSCTPLLPDFDCISDCLLETQANGVNNEICLNKWLQNLNVNSLDFFEYEKSMNNITHACQVFSGPAKLPGLPGEKFRHCLEEYEDSGICKLPSVIWSGKSSNKVPVASDHATIIYDKTEKLNAARNEYVSIQTDVKSMLESLGNWNSSKLNVVIFSAEGDLLHQYFDCYMMGAASEASMWPGSGDLPKPSWYRNKDRTRDFELPCSGEALRDRMGNRDTKSPFTCGSFTRRSILKYFLRNSVQSNPYNNSNIVAQAVKDMIEKLKQAWVNTDINNYMCECSDGTNSADCCTLGQDCDPESKKCPCLDGSPASFACCEDSCENSSFLPERFKINFAKIKGPQLVQTLFDQASDYLSSTIWTDKSPWLMYDVGNMDEYNWTKNNLQEAVDNALFDTTIPVVKYDITEVGYPFKATFWDYCHGLYEQIYFTMPSTNGIPTNLPNPFDPDTASQTINLTYREEYVKKLTMDAFKSSPLYWHYISRHKPSPSAFCTNAQKIQPKTKNSTYYTQGYEALKIGRHEVDCYCGWWFNASHCKIPTEVCSRLLLLVGSQSIQNTCNENLGLCSNCKIADWMSVLIKLEGGWKDWPCPSMSVSDHWGIIKNKNEWMLGNDSTLESYNYILQNGTYGLRVGSMDWIVANAVKFFNPSERIENVHSLECDLNPSKILVDNFIDDLFPALQGVRQAAPVSYCLRFTIELARLFIYEEAKLVLAAAEQTSVVAVWRKRCEKKIEQVSFCQVYGIFDHKKVSSLCPFSVSVSFNGMYSITDSCLVIYNKKVYDPCICSAQWCSTTSIPLFPDLLTSNCELFYVPNMVVDRISLIPPWGNTNSFVYPLALARSLFENQVLNSNKNIANNPTQHWSSEEGSSFHYCDLVLDWWPENWKHPVGYHVTLPCTDANYRTFDAAWGYLKVGTDIKMIHVPHAFRNETLSTNVFGAAGFCRTHNYGMPMKVVNTIRFCTKTDNRAVDPTVPDGPALPPDWGQEYCTDSPYDVPWKNGPKSVGTFFNYLVDIAEYQEWGPNSGHSPLRTCSSNADCCSTCSCLLSKLGGVCAILQPGTYECSQHQHCSEKLCAGNGKCVQPILEINNTMDFDIVQRVFTDQCQDLKFDTWGSSKEEIVEDILQSSGLCSYRSWFEHRNLKNCSGGICYFDGSQPWMFSSSTKTPRSAFDANLLKVKAHACDRSYEHLDNLYSCFPSQQNTRLENNIGQVQAVNYGKTTRTYDSNKLLKIIQHSWSNTALGFLGLPKLYGELGYGTANAAPTGSSMLKPCNNFGLCATQADAGYWYVNGKSYVQRLVTVGSTTRLYTIEDTMTCGGMGFRDGSSCRIDPAVAPLFYYHCSTSSSSICSSYIGGLYVGNTKQNLQNVANNLNNLLNSLRVTSIDTWDQYVQSVETVMNIWNYIDTMGWLSSFPNAKMLHKYDGQVPRGLYYFFSYSAYEFPYAWWYRCGWLKAISIGQQATFCDAWEFSNQDPIQSTEYYTAEQTNMNKISGKDWLAQAPGVFTFSRIQNARNNVHQYLVNMLKTQTIPNVDFACFTKGYVRKDIEEELYFNTIFDSIRDSTLWPSNKIFQSCTGFRDCIEHSSLTVDATKNLVQDTIGYLATTPACSASCKCTTNNQLSTCAISQDNVQSLSAVSIPKDKKAFPIFKSVLGTVPSMSSKYNEFENGCSTIHCCKGSSYTCTGTRQIDSSACSCMKKKASQYELSFNGIVPQPDVKPWLIMSSQKPVIVTPSENYIVSGNNYVAINLCKPSNTGGQCTFADEFPNDDCSALVSGLGQTVRNLYCSSTSPFSKINQKNSLCSSKRSSTNLCFENLDISNKYVIAPSNLNLEVRAIQTPPKQCWTLKCPSDSPFFQYDGSTTYDPTGFAGEYYMELRTRQISYRVNSAKANIYFHADATNRIFLCQSGFNRRGNGNVFQGCWDFSYTMQDLRRTEVEVWLSYDKSSLKKIATLNTRYCYKDRTDSLGCSMNSKRTRSLSGEFDTGIIQMIDLTSYPELNEGKLRTMITTVVKQSEDYLDQRGNDLFCQNLDVNSTFIKFCSDESGKYRLNQSSSCTATERHQALLDYTDEFCAYVQESEWYITDFCASRPWENKRCQNDARDLVGSCGQCGKPGIQNCREKFWNAWESTANDFQLQCSRTTYSGLFDASCTRTGKMCSFDESVQKHFVESGLPQAGFCPSCSGTACGDKGSVTYNTIKANKFINDIVFSNVITSSSKTPVDTSYITVVMGDLSASVGPPRCNQNDCGTNFYQVEIYQGMYACVPCKVVPSVFCSGNHMCKFLPWAWDNAPLRSAYNQIFTGENMTITSVLQAVEANIRALVPSTVDVVPEWQNFLNRYDFEGYNPSELKAAYNDNMESLDTFCTKNDKIPKFTECQNDEPRRNLKMFVENYYKHNDGILIPSKHTLKYYVSKSQLMSTNIVSWYIEQRNSFFDQLFNDSVCKTGTISNLICYKNSTATLAMNPVLSGKFEIQEGCDVVETDSTRIIDSVCNAFACVPNDINFYDYYNTFDTSLGFANLNTQMRCKLKNGATAQYLSTQKSFTTNLCSKSPDVPSTCANLQGMLGHEKFNGDSVQSVYSRLRWQPDFMLSGLLSGKNNLLNMKPLQGNILSNLTLDPYDISGHYIRMKLENTLKVTGIPLQSYTSLSDASTLSSVDWLTEWRKSSDNIIVEKMFALKTCTSWDCPFRRRYFWSGQHSVFRPYVPNPLRSKMFYDNTLHPTTRLAKLPEIALNQRYKTLNGFCVCLSGDSCSPSSGECSTNDTINSLSDFQYRNAAVLHGDCQRQLDWPFTGGSMRDNSTLSIQATACGILNRLAPFSYRFKNSKIISSVSQTTLDDGGDCHMGRSAAFASTDESCKLVEKQSTYLVVNCKNGNMTVPRPKSGNVQLARKRKCSECDPLPKFYTPNQTLISEPEVSYGSLWRWAPARVLAQDIRFRLCGNATTCPQMKTFDIDTFWTNYLNNNVLQTSSKSVKQLIDSAPEDQDDWFQTPWMLCTNDGSGQNCQGTASKKNWLSNRHGTCSSIKNLPNANDAISDLSICDLDDDMNYLCSVIQNARYRLFEANCKLSGKCRTSSFFYQPATYSITNDKLVRETVQYFYNYSVSGSCPVMDAELANILQQNKKTAQQCSAQSFELFQMAIGAARSVLQYLVKIVYYWMEIGINLISLILTSDPNPVIKMIMTNFQMLLNEFKQFFQSMGDLFFKMIMDTGQFGLFIRKLVEQICNFLSWLVDNLVKPVTCFIKDFSLRLIDFLDDLVTGFTFGTVRNVQQFRDWKDVINKNFDCNFTNPFQCSKLFSDSNSAPSNLPMPTRCWMGYKPSIGEQQGLGCVASDTCMNDDGTLTACAACSGDVEMTRYGCDPLTKLCRCHTFPYGKTQCSSHQECFLPDTECSFVDGYLEPSFGNIPCQSCLEKPVCLITSASSYGVCSCMLKSTTLQSCPSKYHAQRISPDPTQLCLASLGIGSSTSSAYSANYRDLVSTACANLNGAQTWCLNVWLDSGTYNYLTVGLSMLGNRRRLLSVDIANPIQRDNWTLAPEPCKSLMLGEVSSVVDRFVKAECIRWRDIGENTILTYNLSSVDPLDFLTFSGMMQAKVPMYVYLHVLQYADWFQPFLPWVKKISSVAGVLMNATDTYIQQFGVANIANTVQQVHDLFPFMLNGNDSLNIGRHLLHWKDDLKAAQQYSVEIANDKFANLAPTLANVWNEGPFFWPPNYDYNKKSMKMVWNGTAYNLEEVKENHICLVASITYNLTIPVLESTVKYYQKNGPPRPKRDDSFLEALPKFPSTSSEVSTSDPLFLKYFKSLVTSITGWNLNSVKSYFSSPDYGLTPSAFSNDLNSILKCDFEKVQHCTAHKKSLFWGAILVSVLFAFVSYFAKLINVPMMDPILMLLYVPAVMIYVFGYSPMCVPMIPTCYMDEVLSIIEFVFPVSYGFPNELQHWEGCFEGSPRPSYAKAVRPGTVECIRECTEYPFDYQSWEDNVAWLQCDLGYCDASFVKTELMPYISMIPYLQDILQFQRYINAVERKAVYLQIQEKREAQRLCCFFSIFNIIPAIFLLLLFLVLIMILIFVAFTLVQTMLFLMASVLAYIYYH